MSKIKKAAAVLVSGGVDSSILLADMASQYEEVFPVYIRCGYRWEKAELHWLEKFIEVMDSASLAPLIILELPMKDLHSSHWSMTGKTIPGEKSAAEEVYLPGRNLLLVSKGAVFCAQQKVDKLALALLKGNPFPDATENFFKHLNAVVQEALHSKLTIETPYLEKSKKEILVKAAKTIPIEYTFSCLNPVEFYHCGVCNKCAERQKAFASAKLEDPTGYVEAKIVR